MSLLFDVTMYGRFNEIRNSEKRQFTMASNNDKKLTSTEIVIQEIAETILSGELKPGDKLLTERELAEKYQVTRSCVREAIRSLSLIGMLDIRPGGGSYVADSQKAIPANTVLWMYHQNLHEYGNIYAVRKLVETEVYLECFDHMTDAARNYIAQARDMLLNVNTETISAQEMEATLADIDLNIGNFCGNNILCKLMQTVITLRMEASLNILSLNSSRVSTVYYRCKILTAMLQDDRKIVKDSIRSFFKNSIKELNLNKKSNS